MTAKKIALAALGAALLAGASIPAFAAPPPPPPGPAGQERPGPDGPRGPRGPGREMMKEMLFVRLLKTADANKDAKISKEEMTAWEDQLFTQIDANKDGFVTRGELLDFRTAKMEEFRKAHPDPKAEDDKAAAPDQAMDDDADDGPDGPDAGPRGPHGDHDRGPGHRHGHRDHDRREAREMGPRDPRMGPRFFRMLDEDRDGKVSKAEATAATDKLFTMLDTNTDGQITVDDLPDRPL